MINLLYKFVNKGSWRALSFILAVVLTLFLFFNINQFASELRDAPIYWVLLILWSIVILWVHGIGFEIRSTIWIFIFFPLLGYMISVVALIANLYAQ